MLPGHRAAWPCIVTIFISVLVSSAATRGTVSRELTFEDRVRAQEAIERVYYSHMVGAKQRFEEAVPRELLEKKVRTYLEETAALETFWSTPVTGRALKRELERISDGTRFPERVLEIYAALGNDAFVIEECFARPILVDRLARNFFASDRRIHGNVREEAERLRRDLESDSLELSAPHPGRREIEWSAEEPGEAAGLSGVLDPLASSLAVPPLWSIPGESFQAGRPPRGGVDPAQGATKLRIDPETFRLWRSRLPRKPGEIGPVEEERDAFVVRALISSDESRVREVDYSGSSPECVITAEGGHHSRAR